MLSGQKTPYLRRMMVAIVLLLDDSIGLLHCLSLHSTTGKECQRKRAGRRKNDFEEGVSSLAKTNNP